MNLGKRELADLIACVATLQGGRFAWDRGAPKRLGRLLSKLLAERNKRDRRNKAVSK